MCLFFVCLPCLIINLLFILFCFIFIVYFLFVTFICAKMRFLSVKGPELLSKYIGESEAGVRKVGPRSYRFGSPFLQMSVRTFRTTPLVLCFKGLVNKTLLVKL